MKRTLIAIVAVLALAVAVLGQNESELYKGLKYDKSKEAKLSGVIEEVREFDCPVSKSHGNHLVLKTLTGTVVVHTAPVKFMDEYGIDLKKGETIEVTGSKLKDSTGGDTVLAREVVRDRETFRFRDPEGKPIW